MKDPLNEVGASLRSFTEVNRKVRIRLTFTVQFNYFNLASLTLPKAIMVNSECVNEFFHSH